MTRRGWPGCSRPLGRDSSWCVACAARIPREITDAVQLAHAAVTEAVNRGVRWLRLHPAASERDAEILTLIADGMSDAQIAARLCIGVNTVKDHLRRMSKRWGCSGRAHLVSTAYRAGMLKIRNRELV